MNATIKQTFAIFRLTGIDCRNLNLDKETISQYIARLINEQGSKQHKAAIFHSMIQGKSAPVQMEVKPKVSFQDLWNEADKAGKAAAEAKIPTPMIVGHPSTPLGNDIDPNKQTWLVPDGVCGFAYVNFNLNQSFGKWALKQGLICKYSKGGGFSVFDYGQSYERKTAYANAFAGHLQSKGIACRAES